MKLITSIWSTIILSIILIVIRISDPSLVEQFRLNTFDAFIGTIEETQSKEIVLLNISEETLDELGQYPFPRATYAQMISHLRNANAGMIGFTIMFPEAERSGRAEVFDSWIKDN